MIEIRFVTADDVPDVIALVTESLAEFGLEFGKGSHSDDDLLRLPASYAGGAFWGAHSDGALVGTCGVFPVGPHTYELRKMYLRTSARGLGLGARLLDIATAWARAAGGRSLVLDTVDTMTRAIAFYEAHGFTRDDTQIRGARCERGYTKPL